MFKRGMPVAAVLATGLLSLSVGCHSTARSPSETKPADAHSKRTVHYVEIVSEDVDALVALYQSTQGISFGPPDSDLGQARVATMQDGTLVGIRKPLAAHEQPIVRTYFAVQDIRDAVKKAEGHGATTAYGPTRQGDRGTFAIVIEGGVQQGLWQP